MAQYLAKINKLASIVGYSANSLDRLPIMILEDDIANLTADNAAKRQALSTINEELEKVKLEFSALKEEEKSLDLDIQKELENCHTRVQILKHYTDTIENKEEFLINKVTREIEAHNQVFYDQLKELHNKASEIHEEFEQMRALQRECDEMRQKAVQ